MPIWYDWIRILFSIHRIIMVLSYRLWFCMNLQWNACADPVKIFQFLNKVVNKYYSLEQQGVKIKYTKYILTLWRSPIYRYNVCLCRSCYTITILKQLPVIWTIDSYKTITCKRVPLLFDVLKIKCVFSHIK
jgi:hypothetical protein